VKNALNPQAFGDLDEHRGVFDIDDLPGGSLGDVQCQPEDVRIRLVKVDEAGGNKSIHKFVQLERVNPMRIQLARFVVEHDNLQAILCLELAD
jgi:hypothetical protein